MATAGVQKIRSAGTLALLAFAIASPMAFGQKPKSVAGQAKGREASLPAADLSGVWAQRQNAVVLSPAEPPMQPWAAAAFKAAKPGYGPRAAPDSQDPILSCMPPGVPRIMLIPFPMQIVQASGQVIMLFEYDHYQRIIDTNRREHPKDLDLSWMGDSIGHWEGGTLVVDTVGMNDKTWLDQVGHPHSTFLHVVERLHRVDRETLADDITIDDPKAYTKPWSGQLVYRLRPGWHLIEYICLANKNRLGR